jgi:hypothetical protein
VRDGLRVARFYFVLLAVFAVGRWVQSLANVDYETGHHVFSIVILTFLASAYFAAFCRRWRGYGLLQAVLLGMTLGLAAQVVILLSTFLSYALGLHTFFNHPRVLGATEPVPMGEAMVTRAFGLLANTIANGVAAFIGWLLGALLPEHAPRAAAAPRPAASVGVAAVVE